MNNQINGNALDQASGGIDTKYEGCTLNGMAGHWPRSQCNAPTIGDLLQNAADIAKDFVKQHKTA
jgi:hypothetical protein